MNNNKGTLSLLHGNVMLNELNKVLEHRETLL